MLSTFTNNQKKKKKIPKKYNFDTLTILHGRGHITNTYVI